jgi:hypothetical protein
MLRHIIGVVMWWVLTNSVASVVSTQNHSTPLLNWSCSHNITLRIQSQHELMHETILQGLLCLPTLTRRQTSIKIFVEETPHEVISLTHNTIAIEVIAVIRNAATLSSLL